MEINIELLLKLPYLQIADFTLSDKEAHIHCEFVERLGTCPHCPERDACCSDF